METENIINRGIVAGYILEDVDDFDINTAIVLNRLRWLHKHTKRSDKFSWQTAQDWYEYTRLSDYQVKKSLDLLVSKEIIELKNTYISGTQVKCRHHRFLKSDSKETSKSETQETSKSETQETSKPIYSNKEHSKEHSNIVTKVTTKSEILVNKNPITLKSKRQGQTNPQVQALVDLFEKEYQVPIPKAQRRYASIIIKRYGYENALKITKLALDLQSEQYFPRIADLQQLHAKMAYVANYVKNNQARKQSTQGGGIVRLDYTGENDGQ